MKSWILILPLLLNPGACKKTQQQKTAELQALLDDSCAQNPVHFLEQEAASGRRLYVFGPDDATFRQEWRVLQDSYHASGRDLSGQEKTDFVAKYMPRFLQGCTQFFAMAVVQCHQHPLAGPELQQCMEPYNAAFRRYLDGSLIENENGWLDLESLPMP